jgi:Tfp pilus assembly protein PilV
MKIKILEKFAANNQGGLSLIELLVTVFVFSIVGIITTGIFAEALRIERKSFGAQYIQENALAVFELMAKEIRVANIAGPDNNCTSNTLDLIVYDTGGNAIPVTYSLNGGLIVRRYNNVDLYVSNNDVIFDRFVICIQNSALDDIPTRVTILATISNRIGPTSSVDIQTTVTSRDVVVELQN